MSTLIHKCGRCGHHADSHSAGWTGSPPRVGPCSMGGCSCRLTPQNVRATWPDLVEVWSIPAHPFKGGE